jgi:hypothetical protein
VIQFAPPITLAHHDKVIWAGDLNFRLRCPPKEARELAKNPSFFRQLAKADELYHAMSTGAVLSGYDEGRLEFAPTYKYDVDTDRYDSSAKARAPAWCDRVLWGGGGGIWGGSRVLLLSYAATSTVRNSDHRPVKPMCVCVYE